MYKLLGILALVTLVASNDLSVGLKDAGRKIFDEKRVASPAIWRQSNNVTVNATDGEVISRIVITDLRPEKDGDVKIVDGGEGQKNVTFELKSPTVFRGYEFQIEVYAVSDNNGATDQQNPTDVPKQPVAKTQRQNQPNIPIAVSGETVNDNTRKTRKTEINTTDGVTPFDSTMASTTPSTEDVHSTTSTMDHDTTKDAKDKTTDEIINIPIISGMDSKETATTVTNVERRIDSDGLSPPLRTSNSLNKDVSMFTNPRDTPKTDSVLKTYSNPTTAKNELLTTDLKVGSTLPSLVSNDKTPSQPTFTLSTEKAAIDSKSIQTSTDKGVVVVPKVLGAENNSEHDHKFVKPIPYNH